MLAFPVINARLDREGIRVEVVRCQIFRLSCSEGMFKAWWPWSPGGSGQLISYFCASSGSLKSKEADSLTHSLTFSSSN